MIHYTDAFPGREISVAGKSYLYFGGTSYLGLQTNPEFQELYIQNIRKYGTNYGASRKSNIKISVFDKAEASLASIIGSESCTTLSSGYLAGQLVAKHFDSDAYTCFYAPNSHSALFQKDTKPFENFKELLQSINASSADKTPVLFLDSIDTLECCYPNFNGLQSESLKDIILVVDDSHGIGIMGENGTGAYQIIKNMKPKELIVCSSLGKGFGIQAGTVFGTKSRIEALINTNFFGGASPATPAAIATLYQANSIFKKQRAKLKENIDLFIQETNLLNQFHFIEAHPTFSFENAELATYLEDNGILITNFNYPHDAGPLMSRIVISAAHTKSDIQQLATVLNAYQ